MNRYEDTRRKQWNALEQLWQHELIAEEYWDDGRGARWVISRPGTNNGRCEIIAGIFGSLIVHGDYDLCRFACYGDKSDAWSRLRWMADGTDIDYYISQKAAIGLRRQDVMEYDEDVAKDQLESRIAGNAEESFDDAALCAILREAIEEGHTESREQLQNFLNENDHGWDFWEWSLGDVLGYRVVVSHVALNKCAWLLRERHGLAGPPACRMKVEAA